MTSDQTHIIVGASLAGAKAAETLREEGFEGRVILVGAEDERPYERPPLSKDYLRGEVGREKVYVHDEAFYSERDIELRLGRTATHLDTSGKAVTLDDGERLLYDRLLLATGSEPRRLAIPGGDLDGVLYLRTVQDSDALRERLDRGGAVVVVGAGWIGAEVAASARQRGLQVTVIEPASVPLERVMGAEVGAIYRDIHTDHGVRMLMGTGVEGFEGDQAVERVRAGDGSTLECDFVVVGVGVQPRVQLAEEAGLAVDNGILVDELLQTSAPGVFAAGDVANAQHPFYGERIRVEHWANALHQGPAAARNMLGHAVPFERLPYFFSDQYEVGMEYSGFARDWDRVVFRGDPATPRVHRLLAPRRSRRGGHERQRVGRHRRDPAPHRRAHPSRGPAPGRSRRPDRPARRSAARRGCVSRLGTIVGVPDRLYFTESDEANALIASDPMALLVGFELDQRVTVTKAFEGPLALKERLGAIDAATLAAADLEPVFFAKPVIHRYPRSMAKRVHELAVHVRDRYDGDAARVWNDAKDASELRANVAALPGFGEMKLKSLGAVLFKHFGVEAARDLVPEHPTLGDVDSPQALEDYQEAKRIHKAEWAKARAGGEPG